MARFFPIAVMLALLLSGEYAARADDLAGYRSARFGMDEAAVLQAIEADFAVPADSVERSTHAMEKTTSLKIVVNELVEHTGRTEIAYIFGYQSKRLIQVSLMWRVTSKFNGATPRLKWAAKAMANRMSLLGVRSHEIKPNSKTEDGATLLFRGLGESGMIALVSIKVPSEDKASLKVSLAVDEGYWLRVAFIENAGTLDIFKIDPGEF